jgi:hypothetical protein
VKGVRFQPPANRGARPRANHDRQLGKRVQAGIGIAASLIGLAAYLYLLGGLVMWLRFTAARLPADDALGALDSKRLLAVGMKAAVFEAALLSVLLLAAWGMWRIAKVIAAGRNARKAMGSKWSPPAPEHRPNALSIALVCVNLGIVAVVLAQSKGWVAGRAWIEPLIVGGAAGVLVAFIEDWKLEARLLDSTVLRWGLTVLLSLAAIFIVSAPTGIAMLVLVALAHLSRSLSRLPTVRDLTHLIPAVLVVGGLFTLVVAAYRATPPVDFDRAMVVTTSGHSLVGGYVGRSSDGMIVATCVPSATDPMVSHSTRLRVIAPDQIHRVFLGGARYSFDYGKDPSLFDIATFMIRHGQIKELVPTTSLDFRHNRFVCGGKEAFRIAPGNPTGGRLLRAGMVREWVNVFGAGTLSLHGIGIKPVVRRVKRRSTLWLPVIPTGDMERELVQKGSAETEVAVTFDLDDEDSDATETDTLHLEDPAVLASLESGGGPTPRRSANR